METLTFKNTPYYCTHIVKHNNIVFKIVSECSAEATGLTIYKLQEPNYEFVVFATEKEIPNYRRIDTENNNTRIRSLSRNVGAAQYYIEKIFNNI